MKGKPFTAEQFTPTKWSTAAEKAEFANRFIRFLESDCRPTLFTKKFYNRLSNTFSHIAHYNQAGFYETWFSSPGRMAEFVRWTLKYWPCGSPEWTYVDVERALQAYLHESDIPQRYADRERIAQETAERAQLDYLTRKYQPAQGA